MKHNLSLAKQVAACLLLTLGGAAAHGQSQPSPTMECGEYQWPEVQLPCPEVQVKQKHDHTPLRRYRQQKWDTVVTCDNREIILSCMPYIPVRYFNGTYYVDEIPYNPPDPSFWIEEYPESRQQQAISSDDRFAPTTVSIAYPFYFFGIRKNYFRLGDNGIVTFTTNFSSDATSQTLGCPYVMGSSSNGGGIPWNSNTTPTYSGSCFNRMHDAIYGVYEDTFTGAGGAYMTGQYAQQYPHCGIYYGVVDESPCRKIIASWNSIPIYNNPNQRNTYQIVCYEGSNIIEVHVKEHQYYAGTSSNKCILGIQNATGEPQVASSDPLAPNQSPSINGKPAAFYPSGFNPKQGAFSNKAFRFTPAGTNQPNYEWLRLLDDGTTVPLSDANTDYSAFQDTNGYYYEMDPNVSCKTLTRAVVRPKKPTKYIFHMKFMNANSDWYNLYDTVFVGVDTADYINLHKTVVENTQPKELDICLHDTARMRVDFTTIQESKHEEWKIMRIAGGDTIGLDTIVLDSLTLAQARRGTQEFIAQKNYLTIGNFSTVEIFRHAGQSVTPMEPSLYQAEDYDRLGDSLIVRQLRIFSDSLPTRSLMNNKIDSIYIEFSADFMSGCTNHDSMLVRIFPNFDTTEQHTICRGESFLWAANGRTYTESTNPATTLTTLHSQPGCDSVARLALTVLNVSTKIDTVVSCRPVVWHGHTYSHSNITTMEHDTVMLLNQYGCDSIVMLMLTINPVKARLESNIAQFTFDNLNAQLKDISTGGRGRVWYLPDGQTQTSAVIDYSIPVEQDAADIMMVELSAYGECTDTARIHIPFNKETFWVPNAFTPDNPAGNYLFGSVSSNTTQQEMLIYNRRGEMVFQCEGVDCTWDGRDMSGNPCLQGAYVYIIRYINKFDPKTTKVVKGTVTLIR